MCHFVGRKQNSEQCQLKTEAALYWPKKPDIDNLVKFVLDAANGVLFKDDSQVVRVLATKMYDDRGDFEGRTHVSANLLQLI